MKQELVLLHGWGFQSPIWEPFLPYLNTHFNVTALDLLGFGENSNTNETLILPLLAKNILEKSPKTATYIGWSLGGLVAMYIAIHHPDRIHQLITFATTPKFIADESWPGMPSDQFLQFSSGLKKECRATLRQFTLLQFPSSNVDRRILQSLRKQVENNAPISERALSDGLSILKNTDLRKELIKIECPQLFLYGRHDTLVPSSVAEKIMSLSNKAKTEVLSKVGHAPFLSNPSLCADRIRAFLLR